MAKIYTVIQYNEDLFAGQQYFADPKDAITLVADGDESLTEKLRAELTTKKHAMYRDFVIVESDLQ